VTFFLVGKNFREECTMSDARFRRVGGDGVDGCLFWGDWRILPREGIHFWSLTALVLKQTSTSDSFAQTPQRLNLHSGAFQAAPENPNFDSSGQE
jgi:hypothetical protein